MNLPGFTAESSLNIYSNQYRSREQHAGGTDGETVVAQRIKLRDVRCSCDTQTDICVCDNGRVLHAVLGNL
jgi:hypothetical protein